LFVVCCDFLYFIAPTGSYHGHFLHAQATFECL
jgi:hypothetical protein